MRYYTGAMQEQEPQLRARDKEVADYILSHQDCTTLTAIRATKQGAHSASDRAQATQISKRIGPYLEYHRARIASIVATATKPQTLVQTLTEGCSDIVTRIVHDAIDRLRNCVVDASHVIAYAEQVLVTGADQVLLEVASGSTRLSHLIESYELTEDVDGEGNVKRKHKVKLMSKKDSISVLTVLKAFKPVAETKQHSFEDPALYILANSTGPEAHP